MTLIAELESLLTLLEAQIPANPNSHERSAKRFQEKLSKYFNKLGNAFPYSKLGSIYNKHVKESLASDTGNILDPLLKTFDATLTTEVSGEIAETYLSGSAEMISWGKTKAGVPIAFEGPPIGEAVEWAEKRGATLVAEMDVETKRRLGKTISDGIKNKRGVPGLARDIRGDFENMSKYRSELIAKTETRSALFQSSQDRMIDMGITGKEWVLGSGGAEGNCPLCQANASVGVIAVNSDFPNPQGSIHPGCTCAIAPAVLKK